MVDGAAATAKVRAAKDRGSGSSRLQGFKRIAADHSRKRSLESDSANRNNAKEKA